MKNKLLSRMVWDSSLLIRKSTTSLKALTFLLVMVMSSNLWAATKTSTLTFTAACNGSGTADDGVTWTVTSDAAESNYDATKGIHYGTSSKAISYLTLTSGSFDKKITKVVVNCSDANKTAMTSVTVGGKAFGTSQQETAYNNSAYTFEPTAGQGSAFSGVVVVSMSRTSAKKALYVKSIAVTYEEGETPTEPVAPSITTQPEGATYEKDATATALSVEASGNPAPTYQWYSNATKSTSGASLISGATDASYTPSTATVGTTYYYCVATNSKGSATSDIVTVTVTAALPKITITADKIADFGSSYADRTWADGDISGKCNSYRAGSTGAYLMQFNDNPYVYNTVAVPGFIKSIKIVKGGGSDRSWSVYCGTSALTSKEEGTQIGTAQTVSTSYTWTVPDNTEYTYFYITKGSNSTQISEFVITYEELAPTNEAVTFTAPEGGSLVIKNGATPISSGTTIQDGTVLDVTFGMTPAEAYKDVAIKVTNTSTSEDVTSTVYNSETKKITMPRYAITVAVTFTKLYKITLATAGEGSGTATINGGVGPVYVSADDEFTLVAEEGAGSEFGGWSATGTIVFDDETDATTTALAETAGTITATFNKKQCTILGTPQNVQVTDKTYSGAKLTWDAVANADYYEVYITKGAEAVEDDLIEGTEYTISSTLSANTEYSYSIIATSEDEDTYCASNPAEGNFTTADYPAVVLTLSENGTTSTIDGKLNTPITLPTTSTQACDGKVFMGWSETAIDGEAATATLLDATYTFNDPNTLTATIYAVYAKKVEGDKYFEKVSSAPSDWRGKYLIVYETGKLAMDGSLATLDAASNTEAVTISNNKIAWSAEMEAITFTVAYKTGSSTVYSLKSASGKYISGTTTSAKASNGMKQADTDADYEISFNGLELQSKSSDQQMVLKYNKSDGQTRFRFYKSGQDAIAMYKYSATIDYSNYCTTCQAAVAAPQFNPDGGKFNSEQSIELTATEGDIYYTINGGTETLYEEEIVLDNRGTYEISAYAKVDDRTSETVTKTYTLDWPYTSLAELAAADIPSGTEVTISFENAVIKSLATGYSIKGVYFDVQKEGKDIEIYCNSTAIPEKWKVGGTLSITNLTCAWVRYPATGNLTCWELTPSNWNSFTYNDPVHITSIAISGEPTNKDYSDGQQLNPAGLVVTGTYSDSPEHTEVITEGLTWVLPTLTEDATSAQVSVKYTEPILSNELTSDPYQVTINAVTPAKTLQSIYVADDSKHKTEFFVGRPFSAEGLKVMAHYNMGDDQQIAVANLDITNTTFSEAKAEHAINISYTENGVEKTTSYNVEVTYMNLNDLVAATDINDHDHVYVKFENVMITKLVSKGILLNVQKGDKDIEIYNQSANCSNTWEQYGTVSATLDNVEWTNYQGTWEFKISNWDVVEYAAPNIPVTSMEISPAEVSVGEAKTTTLSIVYTPEHATNTGVTWAVTEGSDYASVDAETGVVTGLKAGTATITATLKADENITATRTVTVTETAKCEISYYVKGEVASTQNIAREEEGTLTYVPELVVAGYTFAGWAEDAIAEESATATLISTYTPTADEATKNVYAVFKRVDDSSPTYQQYAKVTSALTDWAGDYLIAYSDEIFANGKVGGTDGIGKQSETVDPESALSNNVVTKEWGDQYKVTLEEISAGSKTYVLKTQDGKYNYQTSNTNGLSATATKSTAAQYPITITFTSENDVKLALGGGANGAVFRYNDQGFFRYYKDGGQKAIYLYKYDEGSVLYTSNPVAKVKVTFNLDGGVGGCGTITVNEGENAVLCEDAPTKDLNKFKAWSDGENEYAPSATIENVTEDIELTALWIAKKQYTISFNKAGAAGTTPDAITDYEYNEVTLPVQGDLSNPGYVFSGWNDGETTHAGGATFTMPEKNVSMTAVWVAKTNDKWYLVTSADQLAAGKQYAVVANTKDMAMGAMVSGKTYMANVSASFNTDKSMMIAIDPSAVILTLGGNATDGWTLSNNGKFLGSETTKNMSWIETIGDKVGYKWTITIAGEEGDFEATMSPEGDYLKYNASDPRFTTYASGQTAVQLYVLVPAQQVNGEVEVSTLPELADVTVNEGGNLLVTEGDIELGDIYVMVGGKVTIEGSATLTVNNFVIKSTMAGGESGQVIGVNSTNFTITGDAYYDVVLGDNANPNKWHAFAVPFNVDAINGIYDLDDNKLTNEVNYAIMDYHGDVRAQGQYGWKKFRGIMNPGVFYLMTVDGLRTTYRMKMNGEFSASSSTITVNEYASGTDTDAGWNGIANNQLSYSSVDANVQVLDPNSYTFVTKLASTTNFTVGTPFFYQANGDEEDSKIKLADANASEYYAPARVGAAEIKDVNVMLSNNNYTDHLYLSATDEATNEYQIGHDLVKMTMTSTPSVPQIFANAYGTKLCMADVPMVNEEATYILSLYAPETGEYTLSAGNAEGMEVYLMYNQTPIWNLSMSEYTVDLNKGDNQGYSLCIHRAPQVVTGNETVRQDENAAQKFIYEDHLYIIRGGKTFDANGKIVK